VLEIGSEIRVGSRIVTNTYFSVMLAFMWFPFNMQGLNWAQLAWELGLVTLGLDPSGRVNSRIMSRPPLSL